MEKLQSSLKITGNCITFCVGGTMKKLLLVAVAVLMTAGCGAGLKRYGDVYNHGTVAKYNVFVNDIFVGTATYTFTFEKYRDADCLKITRSSETKNKTMGSDDLIIANTQVFLDTKSYKPLYSKTKMEWSGSSTGWHEVESEYGDKIVKWTNKTPAGSQSKDIKFYETYYDEDELSWIVPLLGYREDNRIYCTAFANRSGQPVQGLIWTGGKKKTEATGKTYDTFAASVRLNEVSQNLWFEESTGRLVMYMQTQGFMGYPAPPGEKPDDYKIPDTKYVEVLDSWTEPQN
jgi:hypothetical protein